jgi:pSer/pThr/pTyr-binding forkhead associated (FHA) protein
MPRLVLRFEQEQLKAYDLSDSVITVGRLPENTISIVNMGVSRRHARIELDSQGTYVISDLNSLNGTFVNDTKIVKTTLASGDKIAIGKYTIIFQNAEATDEAPLARPVAAARKAEAVDTDSFTVETQSRATVSTPTVGAWAALPPSTSQTQPVDESKSGTPGCPVLIETTKHVAYKLDKDVVTIGNSESDDIYIDGLFIDESHVAVERRPDGVWLVSKKLFGKVKVNGKKTKDHKLQHKDRIEVGASTLRFMEHG